MKSKALGCAWGSLLGPKGLEQSLEEWICIGEQGGYFCGKNGVSPGHLPDLKGVWCNIEKKEMSWVEWVQIAASQPGRRVTISAGG